MFLNSFSILFLLIYFIFFLLDITTGLHFYDFVEIGIFGVILFFYLLSIYVNISNRSAWFYIYSNNIYPLSVKFGSLSLSTLNNYNINSFSNHSSLLSLYHFSILSYFYNSSLLSSYISLLSYSSFFFSDGIDFLYSSYRSSTLWLLCVLFFCIYFCWSSFTSISNNNTRFYFITLKSHFLLEFNAFFSVVFYVIGLFFFCLVGLVVWYSLFFDNYGVIREMFGCQWAWGETACDISSEWKISFPVPSSDLTISQPRLLTTVRPFLFNSNVSYCVNLSSLDVLHSFGLPKFGLKIDVMPGVVTHASFHSPFPGLISLICSELCGAKHTQMYGEIVFG